MLEISVATVEELLKNGDPLHMIDVREHEEVASGVIPGAQHIPMGAISATLSQLDPEKMYIIICRSGGRSEIVTQFLCAQGYQAKNMVGGMLEWAGPVEMLNG